MLYDAYQAQNDIFGPIRLIAGTASQWLGYPWLPIGDMPFMRGAAAAMELLSHAGMSHQRPDFRIEKVTIDGQEIAVHEEIAASHPFCNLVHFRKDLAREEPTVWSSRRCPAISPTLLRGTVETLLADHNVYLTDWVNARDVPLLLRPLRSRRFCRVGHSFYPAARAAHACRSRCASPRFRCWRRCRCWPPMRIRASPSSMVLMGGPIDTRANPTAVNQFAAGARTRLVRADGDHHGTGALSRGVSPRLSGFLQLAGFPQHEFRSPRLGALDDVPRPRPRQW